MTTGIKQTKEPDIFDPYIEGNFGTLLQILHTSIYCIVVVHYEEGEKIQIKTQTPPTHPTV